MLSILVGLSILRSPTQTPFAAYRLGDRDVTVTLPTYAAARTGAALEVGGWKYEFSHGNLLGRYLGLGGWDEVAKLHEASKSAPVAEWKCRFALFERSDILDKGKDGVLRQRRSGFFEGDTQNVLNSIALFGAMVESYTGGKLKFVPEVQVEEEPMRFSVPQEEPFGAPFAKSYFESRLNGGGYEADDKIYRGPYNSLFFIHSGLTGVEANCDLYGVPISGISYQHDYDSKRPGELARHLFNAWIGHLVYAARKHGYQLGQMTKFPTDYCTSSPLRLRLPYGLITDRMWPAICNLKDSTDYPDHYPAPGPEVSRNWSEVADDPWVKLPLLVVATYADPGDVPIGAASGAFVVEPEFADFVASHGGTAIGFIQSAEGPKLVFKGYRAEGGEGKAAPSKESLSFKTGDPNLAVAGDFGVRTVDDPDRGRVAEISEVGNVRSGWVRLFGGDLGSMDLAAHPILDFWTKPISPAPFAVWAGGQADIFGSYPSPGEDQPRPSRGLQLKENGRWQHVQIDLSKLAAGTSPSSICITPTVSGADWEVKPGYHPTILIDDVKLVSQGPAQSPVEAEETQPDAHSSSAAARALFATRADAASYSSHKSELVALLQDSDEEVKLNAAAAYTRVKDRSMEPALGELTKNLNSRIAEMSMEALAYQGTDTARGPLINCVIVGPFEHNKYFACTILGRQKDPFLGQYFSDVVASLSWETRLAAARATEALPGVKAALILPAFLQDKSPEVVLSVAKVADTSQELLAKRMEWYAINDAHDAIRAWSDIALIKSSVAELSAEGYRGLKDDSKAVRLIVLDYLKANPDEEGRASIRASLADPNPEVRAAALKALGTLPGVVNSQDVEPVNLEKDPRVQDAFIELVAKKGVKLTAQTIDLLRHSPDPGVSERARALSAGV